ncbi:DUF6318 family protein [Myceligenerans crystallogenes]|uniref:DUF6318 domain-containing protein n=1 Tax=Myceligenerans crystallogenes TaxID=316335 RepID=A0ABP4ZME0_9MICO
MRIRHAMAGGLVLLLALAGCTGEPTPSPEPTGSGTTTPATSTPSGDASATPEVQKPDRPQAMERDDARGAAAAAEYFIELYPYVMATADTAEFEAMSHEACGFCDGVLKDARAISAAGNRFVGGDTQAEIKQIYDPDAPTSAWPLDLTVTQSSSKVEDETGAEVSTADARDGDVRVEIGLRDGSWVVLGITEISGQ